MKKKFYRWLAKRRLINRYEYLNEVNGILEEHLTAQILNGGSQEFIGRSREQLITLQNETKSQQALINFLKTI